MRRGVYRDESDEYEREPRSSHRRTQPGDDDEAATASRTYCSCGRATRRGENRQTGDTLEIRQDPKRSQAQRYEQPSRKVKLPQCPVNCFMRCFVICASETSSLDETSSCGARQHRRWVGKAQQFARAAPSLPRSTFVRPRLPAVKLLLGRAGRSSWGNHQTTSTAFLNVNTLRL